MKRRILTAFLAMVLIFSMAIPALAATGSYTYETTVGDGAMECTATCKTNYYSAGTGYSLRTEQVATNLTIHAESGSVLSDSAPASYLSARVSATVSYDIDYIYCEFKIVNVYTHTATVYAA